MNIEITSIKTFKRSKKLGRGIGSGVGGHTVGRGGKGQTARGGHKQPRPDFEGGQNPLSRRLPKLKGFSRGFVKLKQIKLIVHLSKIDALVKENNLNTVDLQTLVDFGLINLSYGRDHVVKVLFDEPPSVAINLVGVSASKRAVSEIIKAGGSVT